MESIKKENLDMLVYIQALERNIQIVETKLKDIPQKMEALDKNLENTRGSITEMESDLKNLKKKYRFIEEEVAVSRDREIKNKEKLGSVKTNKEYQAVLKEIDDLKKKISALEDEMLVILEQIEECESLIAEKTKESEVLFQKIEQDKEVVQAEFKEEEKKLADFKEKREKAGKMVDPKLFEKYTWVQNLVGPMAIVTVKKAVCQGCHLNIPHQMYNELQRCDSLRFCPHCQRMIYFDCGPEQGKRSPGFLKDGPEESPNTAGQGAP